MLFQKLLVWRDSQARSGPENMAIDEWLMTQLGEVPIYCDNTNGQAIG